MTNSFLASNLPFTAVTSSAIFCSDKNPVWSGGLELGGPVLSVDPLEVEFRQDVETVGDLDEEIGEEGQAVVRVVYTHSGDIERILSEDDASTPH